MQKKFTTITGFRPSKPLKNVFGPKAPLPIRKWVGQKLDPKVILTTRLIIPSKILAGPDP